MEKGSLQLPGGWSAAKLGSICDINPRLKKSVISDDKLVSFVPMPAVGPSDGTIDVSEERFFGEVKKGYTPFVEHDVLFAKITPCMENGKMAVVPKLKNNLGVGSTEFHVLRPRSVVTSKYLYYYVSSQYFRDVAKRNMTGAVGQKRVPAAYLKERIIPVPPRLQQENIVAEIEKQFSRLDEAVASLKRVEVNLNRYKAAILKAAVEGRLTKEWRKQNPEVESASKLLVHILKERRNHWEDAELLKMKAKGKVPKNDKWKQKYKEPVRPSLDSCPDLPQGWAWATVEQLASNEPRSIQSGPFGSNLKHSEFLEEGKLVVGIDNVQDGYFSFGSDHRISEEKFDELKKYAARPGDVLVTVMATVGRTCLIPNDLEPAIITKHVYRVSPNRRIVLPEYLHLALWGGAFVRKQMFGQTIGQTRPGLNGSIIKQLLIPVPPQNEQKQIVLSVEKQVGSLRNLLPVIDERAKSAERLRQSILQKAFSGKLVSCQEEVVA